jgi:hypothetical protein
VSELGRDDLPRTGPVKAMLRRPVDPAHAALPGDGLDAMGTELRAGSQLGHAAFIPRY